MGDKENYSWLKHSDFILIDMISLFGAFIIAFRLKFGMFDFIHKGSWSSFVVIIFIVYLVIVLMLNPYSGILRRRFYEEIFNTVLMAIYSFLSVCVLLYLFKMGALFSREVFIVMYSLFVCISVVLKYIWRRVLRSRPTTGKRRGLTPFLIVTKAENINEIIATAMAGDILKYDLKAIYVIDSDASDISIEVPQYKDVLILNKDKNFVDFAIENRIADVYFAVRPSTFSKAEYKKLIDNGIVIHLDIEAMLGFEADEQVVGTVGAYNALALGRYSFTWKQRLYFVFKRIFDIFFGLIGCVCLLPVALIVKICTLAKGDKGSILYTQKRIGKDGKEIQIYKFRSMVMNSDEMLKEMLKDETLRKEWEENQKFENDPRVTPIGKILRKTSLDEVPQFINVLKGEMSLVGPRPLVPGELELHNGIKLYNMAKPGITGWWGCNGRSNIEYKERLELEYYYVKNCSFYLDCLCVIRTVFAVLEKDGAK